jgi:hypothetical protein
MSAAVRATLPLLTAAFIPDRYLVSSCHWRPESQAQTTARASMSIDRLNDKV